MARRSGKPNSIEIRLKETVNGSQELVFYFSPRIHEYQDLCLCYYGVDGNLLASFMVNLKVFEAAFKDFKQLRKETYGKKKKKGKG